MAARKKPDADTPEPDAVEAEAVGAPGNPPVDDASVEAIDGAAAGGGVNPDALTAGFIGDKRDPNPNEAYSLESGPDSPLASELS